MEQSANLQLPYIMPSQAQKHVTHNEAIRTLDALVQLAVLDRDLSTPPVSPTDGDRYLVAAGGTGAWTGKGGSVAAWQDGAWAFLAPQAGWLLWVADENRLIGFDGAVWIDAAVHSVNPALLVGINTTADATDRLSVKSPASLFDAEAADHRLKINKAAAGDTASLIFQSGYSGRAEFGLAGDDDWHVKVSADGAVWTEALTVDRTTGRVRLPAALPLGDDNQVVARRHVRELLTANRTYYVRTDGSDSNNGLANTSGGAFLTIQKAVDVIWGTLDLSTYQVTVQIADGTYTGRVVANGPAVGVKNDQSVVASSGSPPVIIQGNNCTPANVLVNTTGDAFLGSDNAAFQVRDLKIQSTSVGIHALTGAHINVQNVDFGACTAAHIQAQFGAYVVGISSYTISGASPRHIRSLTGYVGINAVTITLTGTPAFSDAFVVAERLGYVTAQSVTLSGSATGPRYDINHNSVVFTGGAGASYFPGDAVGTTAMGGQYA